MTGLLKETDSGMPYRLYNVDHFNDAYRAQSFYGNIPLLIANNPQQPYNAGVFWLNASDTYVDFKREKQLMNAHFVSECGALEFFTFLGSSPLDIAANYGKTTGKMPMPQMFTLGYHQCRWDRDTQKDIEKISDKFHEHRIPCDCLWLDIEHTDGKRYFTWDKSMFPDPKAMIEELNKRGRNLVVIVDPHIKVDRNYPVYAQAIKNSTSRYSFPHRRPCRDEQGQDTLRGEVLA